MPKSYAVLFKTHFWDDFTRRQLERLQSQAGRGDVYVVFDETSKPATGVEYGKFIGVTLENVRKLGLAPITTHGSILWYNIDYPHYVAFAELPAYDYYVTVEFDAVIHQNLDTLIDKLDGDGVDYLGFPIRKPASQWTWYPMHEDIYGPNMLVYLSPIAVFSHRAMAKLLERRQEMTKAFESGTLAFWPNNEAFLPNEVRSAGMHIEPLSRYGSTAHYDWWPPMNEGALAGAADQDFVHPVLAGSRYVRSLIHHEPQLKSFRHRGSANHEKLSHFDPHLVRSLLRAEQRRRWSERMTRMLERLHLRRNWYANACAGTARVVQAQSLHNAE